MIAPSTDFPKPVSNSTKLILVSEKIEKKATTIYSSLSLTLIFSHPNS